MSEEKNETGKDDAYLEVSAEKMDELIEAVKLCKPLQFKMLTVLCTRVEISDPQHILAFKKALFDIVKSAEVENMDNKQIGFYVFRKIFEKGLEQYIKENK